MKPLVIFLLVPLTAVSVRAQHAPADTSEVHDLVETPPVLIGGVEGLAERVIYPERARRAGIEGTVFVQFVVDEIGSVQQATCVGPPQPQLCEAARTAVLNSQFTPGMQRGKPVKVRYTLPVDFKLVGGRCI